MVLLVTKTSTAREGRIYPESLHFLTTGPGCIHLALGLHDSLSDCANFADISSAASHSESFVLPVCAVPGRASDDSLDELRKLRAQGFEVRLSTNNNCNSLK
mmetsp:Transcript_38987/g.103000  ORF Transcript_38987/g.103000 Transcript_38987/m.103000 type:complete len:102 (-) Transcript_38987:183-488(-)